MLFGPAAPVVAAPIFQQQQRNAASRRASGMPQGYNASAFPTSYTDPAYAQAEQAAAAEFGVPFDLIASIRVNGERSNADQISSAGAATPYQFIPSTRQGFIDRYNIDPWSSPRNAARAAALHLKESYDRAKAANPNASDAELWARATAEYHGGPNTANHGPVNRSYVQRVMGNLGSLPDSGPAFDRSLFDPALAEINNAQRAAMTPFRTEIDMPERPDMPTLPGMERRDFGTTDQLMEELAPTPFGEENHGPLRRRRLLQGASEALASLPEGAGVGSILGRVGSAMLAGRLSADDEIQARADQYDEAMRQYNMLRLEYEDGKANQMLQEANTQAAAAYQHSWQLYQEQIRQRGEDNQWSIQGGSLVTSTVNEQGNTVINSVPIASLTMPQFAMARAGVQQDIAGGLASAEASENALVTGAVVQAAVADAAETGNGMGMAISSSAFARDAVNMGLAADLFGEAWPEVQEAARNYAMDLAPEDTDRQGELMENYITTQLGLNLETSPEVRAAFEQYLPMLQQQQVSDAQRTERRQAGNTTITTRTN